MRAVAAVVRSAGGPFELTEVELAPPRADEVVVRLVATGMCHTDLVAARDTPGPAVLGHEGAGIVEAVGGEVTSVQPGDPVVLSFAWCGTCPSCARGRMTYCRTFTRLNYRGLRPDGSSAMTMDGAPVRGHFFGQSSFATHSVTTERNVIRIPADLPFEYLAPLGCSVQTGAGAVLNVLRPVPGSSLAVYACGAVGLSAVMAAVLAGCGRIVAVDPNPARRELALRLGATDALDPAEGDVLELTGGVDNAVECVGLPDVLRAALRGLARPGTCVTLGFQGLSNPVELDQVVLLGGRALRGSIEGDAIPQRFIPELAAHHAAGRLPVERLVRTYAFDQINEAAAASERGEAVKPVLIF